MPIVKPEKIQIDFEGRAADLIKEIDKSERAIDKLKASIKAEGEALRTQSAAVKTSTMSWTDFRSAYSVALDVVRVGQQVWQATGQEFINTAEQVKNLSRSLGASAEETSRIIQVADDVRISQQSLKMAFKEAQKDGIEPNIEGLARLSDQYLALPPGVERTQFAIEKFGSKAGPEMEKLLIKGGNAIKDYAASIDKNLIITEKGIKASDDYQASLDTLKDTAYGVQVAFGAKLTPVMNAFMRVVLADVEAVGVFTDVLSGDKSLAEAANEVAEIINNNGFEVFGFQIGDVTNEVENLTPAIEDSSESLDSQKEATKEAEDALKTYKDALDQASRANQDMESMSRTVAKDQKKYAEDHAQAAAILSKAITEGDAEGIAKAKQDIQDLEATWHESANNMIYDMVLVGLSAGGLLDSEQKALDEYAVKAGIKTQADIDEANRRREIADATIEGILQSEDVLAEQRKIDAETLRLTEAATSAEKLAAAGKEEEAINRVRLATQQEIDEQARLAMAAQRTAQAYSAIRYPSMSTGTPYRAPRGTTGGRSPDERDSGGAGIAGVPYMITPKASPEIFIPSENGTFVPNADKAGLLGKTVIYNFYITNPKRETSENSIRSAMRNMMYTGEAE